MVPPRITASVGLLTRVDAARCWCDTLGWIRGGATTRASYYCLLVRAAAPNRGPGLTGLVDAPVSPHFTLGTLLVMWPVDRDDGQHLAVRAVDPHLETLIPG
jgi:hypothetical protein